MILGEGGPRPRLVPEVAHEDVPRAGRQLAVAVGVRVQDRVVHPVERRPHGPGPQDSCEEECTFSWSVGNDFTQPSTYYSKRMFRVPFLLVACGPDVSVQPISSCKTMSRLSKYSNVDIGIAAAPATVEPS